VLDVRRVHRNNSAIHDTLCRTRTVSCARSNQPIPAHRNHSRLRQRSVQTHGFRDSTVLAHPQ
jgi:hypothetical protein